MNPPAITLEVLPAGYGDCLLASCPVGDHTWRLLVDTGPDECWPSLRARLVEIAPNHAGKRHIDLAVISHIDHDHIGGASLLFRVKSLGLTFGDVWFNAPPRPTARGCMAEVVFYACPERLITVAELPTGFGLVVETSSGEFKVLNRPRRRKVKLSSGNFMNSVLKSAEFTR